jgi:hypothetical protein
MVSTSSAYAYSGRRVERGDREEGSGVVRVGALPYSPSRLLEGLMKMKMKMMKEERS